MQDRYAGDLGDFLKLGLLRWLVARRSMLRYIALESCGTSHPTSHTTPTASTSPTSTRRARPAGSFARSTLTSTTVLPRWFKATCGRSPSSRPSESYRPGAARSARCCTSTIWPLRPRPWRAERRRAWLCGGFGQPMAAPWCSLTPTTAFAGPTTRSPRIVPSRRSTPTSTSSAHSSSGGRASSPTTTPIVRRRCRSRRSDGWPARGRGTGSRAARRSSASRGTTRLFLVVPAPAHRDQLRARLHDLEQSRWGDELVLYWG